MQANSVGIYLSMLSAISYAALAGFSVPTQRACIMLLCAYLALLSRYKISTIVVLAMALLLVIAFDPLAVLSIGTWLSFSAVGFLLYFARRDKYSVRKRTWELIILSLFVIYYFESVSFIAPLVNLFLIPLFSLLVVPATLLTVLSIPLLPDIASYLFTVIASLLDVLWAILEWVSYFEFTSMDVTVPFILLVFISLLIIPFLLPKRLLPRTLSVVVILPLLFGLADVRNPDPLKVTVFDVGQGLSILIQTKNHNLIYDTGPSYANGGSAAESVILPELDSRQVDSLSMLIVSHTDLDHAGGVNVLKNNLSINETYSPEKDPVVDSSICRDGINWIWNDVHFKFLHPVDDIESSENNELSCVLKVSVQDIDGDQYSVLLTGDIEDLGEKNLLKTRDELEVDVVIAPHHGSTTSSSKDFVEAVDAQYVVYSTGYANRWNFPKADVKERWQKGKKYKRDFNTAVDGQIKFVFKSTGEWNYETWRMKECRYWHQDCLQSEN